MSLKNHQTPGSPAPTRPNSGSDAPVTSGIFRYSSTDGFTIFGHKRLRNRELGRRLFPHRYGKNKNCVESPCPFLEDHLHVISQLQHYGIALPAGADPVEVLKQAHEEKRCKTVPQKIQETEKQLIAEHTKLFAETYVDSLVAAANKDFELFLGEYFLHRGNLSGVDRRKAPKAMTLVGLEEDLEFYQERLCGIDLDYKLGRKLDGGGLGHVLVIGTDEAAVFETACTAGDGPRLADWMIKHHSFRYLNEGREFCGHDGCDGRNLEGLWAIECPSIESQWPELKDKLTLRIYSDPEGDYKAYVVDFDFGILEGLMRFSYEIRPPRHQGEEKPVGTGDHNRAKVSLLWRGRNTKTGEVQLGDNEKIGEIEINEESGLTEFSANLYSKLIGGRNGKVDFVGYKIPDPDWEKLAKSWGDYGDDVQPKKRKGDDAENEEPKKRKSGSKKRKGEPKK